MPRITPFLWFDDQAREAAGFYTSVFPNSRIVEANDLVVSFELDGQRFNALNGGPAHAGFTETISFVVSCDSQDEIDRYWDALTADGGSEHVCEWLKDKFGLSWQIVPTVLPQLLADPERGEARMQALLGMTKLVIAELEAA